MQNHNIVDGTRHFKKANLLTLMDSELDDIYCALVSGAVKTTNRFMFKPSDLPLVNDAIEVRITERVKQFKQALSEKMSDE